MLYGRTKAVKKMPAILLTVTLINLHYLFHYEVIIINKLLHSLWSGNTRKYSALGLQYCPSLRSGQYCQSRAEYFPVLPSARAIII